MSLKLAQFRSSSDKDLTTIDASTRQSIDGFNSSDCKSGSELNMTLQHVTSHDRTTIDRHLNPKPWTIDRHVVSMLLDHLYSYRALTTSVECHYLFRTTFHVCRIQMISSSPPPLSIQYIKQRNTPSTQQMRQL